MRLVIIMLAHTGNLCKSPELRYIWAKIRHFKREMPYARLR